jgi:hypothetical protein
MAGMAHSSGNTWFERNPGKTYAMVFLALILVIDFVAGLTLIPYDYNAFRCPDAWFHHGLLPDRDALNKWGDRVYEVHTNSLGFKDGMTRRVSARSDHKRILILGDSFAEGIGMEWQETFAGMLYDTLRKAGVEVLNAAVVSYSPKLYYLKTKYLVEVAGLSIDELIVFIDSSDPLNEITYRNFQPYDRDIMKKGWTGIRRFLYRHSFLWQSITRQVNGMRRNPVADRWSPFMGNALQDETVTEENDFIKAMAEWSTNRSYYERWGKEGLRLASENMDMLADLCVAHHIRMSVAVYPWPYLVLRRDLDNFQVKYWDGFCTGHRIGFINLFPAFINNTEPRDVVRRMYIPGDVHWNREGHRHVADTLCTLLR